VDRKLRKLAKEYALRQEPAFLLTFLALKKVRRSAVREPPVLLFGSQQKTKGQQINNLLPLDIP
jgi:hypothetical protein